MGRFRDCKVATCRLEWLGHVARMPGGRIPKSALFGWLPQPCPRYSPRKRWRDVIKKDLAAIDVDENEWYKEACQFRAGWRAIYRLGLENHAEEQATTQSSGQEVREVVCVVCSRTFRRESDKKRHKCSLERQKLVWEQRGAVQCTVDGSTVEEV